MSFGAATDFVPLLATIASPWAAPAGEELEQPQPSKFPWVPVLLGAIGLGLVVWYGARRKRQARRNAARRRRRNAGEAEGYSTMYGGRVYGQIYGPDFPRWVSRKQRYETRRRRRTEREAFMEKRRPRGGYWSRAANRRRASSL